MVRVRMWSLPSSLFLAALLSASFSRSVPGAQFSTVWDIRYTDLKANLRAIACDPLDPLRIYLGTDQKILATSDGGQTWADLQSFRDDKIPLAALPSVKARRYIALIETPEEAKTPAKTAEEEEEKQVGVAPAPEGAAGAAESAALAKLHDLEARQKQAEEEVRKGQAELTLAAAEYNKWQPDDLTVSEVESIEETGKDFVDEPDYSQLAEWLEDRGLTVVVSGGERKRTLADYLRKHEVEGLAVAAAVEVQEKGLEAAQSQLEAVEAQIEAARADRDRAAGAAVEAAKVKAAAESEAAAKIAGEAEPLAEASPVPTEEYISGITDIAIDPSRTNRIIASTFDGIFLSVDRGTSWKLVYRGTGAGQSAVVRLAIGSSKPSVVFAGTLSGLVKSIDGGATWARVEGIIADKAVISLAIDPFDSRGVLAGTEGDGLFQSHDGGKMWRQVFTHVSTEGNSVRRVAFAPTQRNLIYLGTAAGFFKSADAGKTWEKTLGQGLADTLIQYLAVSPTSAGTVYAATPTGVFATADGGRTFRRVTFGLNFRDANFLVFEPENAEALWLVTDKRVCRNGPRFGSEASSHPSGIVLPARGSSLRPAR